MDDGLSLGGKSMYWKVISNQGRTGINESLSCIVAVIRARRLVSTTKCSVYGLHQRLLFIHNCYQGSYQHNSTTKDGERERVE